MEEKFLGTQKLKLAPGEKMPDKNVRVDMLQSKIPRRNLKNMDTVSKLFTDIHTFLQNEVDCWLPTMKDEATKTRIMYEISLGQTHLEDALTRIAKAINYVEYNEGGKNG